MLYRYALLCVGVLHKMFVCGYNENFCKGMLKKGGKKYLAHVIEYREFSVTKTRMTILNILHKYQ